MSDFLCVTNDSKKTTLASRAKAAFSLWDRGWGLLGTASLPADGGLWLKPCRSVHTLFMRYPIDVLFLDPHGVVLSQATLSPWRFSRWESRAESVVELAAGTLARTRTEVGDKISMKTL